MFLTVLHSGTKYRGYKYYRPNNCPVFVAWSQALQDAASHSHSISIIHMECVTSVRRQIRHGELRQSLICHMYAGLFHPPPLPPRLHSMCVCGLPCSILCSRRAVSGCVLGHCFIGKMKRAVDSAAQ